MATEIKPLFRPDAIRPKLTSFVLPARCESVSKPFTSWSNLLGSKQAEGMKETELLADFIRDVEVAGERKCFVYLLGAERMLHPGGNNLDLRLAESKKIGRWLTDSSTIR